MNRIDATFVKLRAAGRAALIPYITVGDPSLAATVPLMRALTGAGADAIEAHLDYLSPAETGQFSSGASATANLALVSWNQLVLYPEQRKPDEIPFAAMTLPAAGGHAGSGTITSSPGSRSAWNSM